jgi:hypothetical protein
MGAFTPLGCNNTHGARDVNFRTIETIALLEAGAPIHAELGGALALQLRLRLGQQQLWLLTAPPQLVPELRQA